MRICLDLDGTLCTIGAPYDEAQPLPGMRDILYKLKAEGHRIIISTARGMGRSAGNPGMAVATIGELTISQLREWDFPYDELLFGKPGADIYVDDKSVCTMSELLGKLNIH